MGSGNASDAAVVGVGGAPVNRGMTCGFSKGAAKEGYIFPAPALIASRIRV